MTTGSKRTEAPLNSRERRRLCPAFVPFPGSDRGDQRIHGLGQSRAGVFELRALEQDDTHFPVANQIGADHRPGMRRDVWGIDRKRTHGNNSKTLELKGFHEQAVDQENRMPEINHPIANSPGQPARCMHLLIRQNALVNITGSIIDPCWYWPGPNGCIISKCFLICDWRHILSQCIFYLKPSSSRSIDRTGRAPLHFAAVRMFNNKTVRVPVGPFFRCHRPQ